jgi:hypothetical protein
MNGKYHLEPASYSISGCVVHDLAVAHETSFSSKRNERRMPPTTAEDSFTRTHFWHHSDIELLAIAVNGSFSLATTCRNSLPKPYIDLQDVSAVRHLAIWFEDR